MIKKNLLRSIQASVHRNKVLIQTDGLVIPKSGSSDDSYIVTATCNRIFCVTPGKGGSFKCDGTCINSTTNICKHVIIVDEKCDKLSDFVQWFKRSKSRPSQTGLALNGAPKSVGTKPSNKKRSNKRKVEIEVLSIFQLKMTEVNLILTFNHLAISQKLPRLIISPVQKQFRQMELLIAVSVNNDLQGSHYSIFRYIITLHSSKCPIIFF